MAELSILIVSYRTPELLRACLASLAKGAAGLDWEAFVVDNAPGDGSADLVGKEFPEVKLLGSGENAGYAKANNRAAAQARGEFLLLLNPDAELMPGAAARLVRALKERPRAGAVGARLVGAGGALQPSTYPDLSLGVELLRLLRAHRWLPKSLSARLFYGSEWDHMSARRAPRISGACLAIRRKAWDEAGPLPEAYFVYGSTHEWCLRARDLGWELWHEPEAVARHLGGRSTQAWGGEGRHLRMLEAHDLLMRRRKGPLFAWAWWALAWASNAEARLAAPLTGKPQAERALLAAEARWLARRLRGGPGGGG